MIRIRECAGRSEERFFAQKLREYFERDLFPDPKDEDRAYFLGREYFEQLEKLHARPDDRLRMLLFSRDGEDIGFVMATIYNTEDDKCFLMEFCVFPEYRGGGTGRACAKLFFDWAYGQGAEYIELNAHTEQRVRFWKSLGFVENGRDDWGDPMYMLPPEKKLPFAVKKLEQFDDWQLCKLVNGLLCEKGGEPLSDEQRDKMAQMLVERKYTVHAAMRGFRMVGICFVRGRRGRIEDVYVEPVFRGQGIEELLQGACQ